MTELIEVCDSCGIYSCVPSWKTRITVDIDKIDRIGVTKCVSKGLSYIPDVMGIKITRSNSKGWHIVFYSKRLISQHMIEYYRLWLGDDKMRAKYDRREKPSQILFYRKVNHDKKHRRDKKK